MSGSARVESVDVIKEFRVYLAKFKDMAGRALGDADSDVNRMSRWLEGEGLNYWTSTIRKRQEELAKAEEALRFKRLYKDASGSTASGVEEMKKVKIAKDRLAQAQEKLNNVKRWTKELQKQMTLYRGGVARFATSVSADVPAAIAHLGALLDHLEEYLDLTATTGEEAAAPAGVGAGAREESGATMSRAADVQPVSNEDIDPAALRAGVPSDQAVLAAKPAQPGPVQLACDALTPAQIGEIAKTATGSPPGDDERIVISPAIHGDSRVFLIRFGGAGASRYFGPVDAPDSGVYNTISVADLRAGRPDFAELLKLPVGFIAVAGPGGLKAVFNETNQNVLQPG